MTNMLRICLVMSLLAFSVCGAVDYRPAFDKSSYKGTLWTQVNPWWVPNKPRQDYSLGGPNYARKIYSDEPVEYWREAMRETQRYGMTGWQFELVANAPGYGYTYKTALKAAEGLGKDFKLAIFVGINRPAGGCEAAWKQMKTQFDLIAKELKEHPNVARVDGYPVISVYTPMSHSVEEWKTLLTRYEKRYGRAIWLMNIWWKTYDVKSKPAQLREYLPYFDGITAYANWSSQKELYDTVGKIMREEFPQKIFEGSVHNTYSVHYYHGGVPTVLSEKYRQSWESMQENHPDSVVMTNLFDHWENSLILPCYEREDFLLRYGEWQMHLLYGKPFQFASQPELVLTNYIDVIPGPRKVRFEVVAFPLQGKDRKMDVGLEVADDTGKIIHVFPQRSMVMDRLQTLVFELPTEEKFVCHRSLSPRIVGRWQGQPWRSLWNPPTILDTSIRTSWMFWARSSRNCLKHNGKLEWSLNGLPDGCTVDWNRSNGYGVFHCNLEPKGASAHLRRILRNGMEWHSEKAKNLKLNRSFALPYPSSALNFYWLEMEAPNGNRTQTFPIWVDAKRRQGTVQLPVMLKDGKVVSMKTEAARVPFFEYPCDVDSGELLLDVSGYEHHGRLQHKGKINYAYGSLGRTGYYHHHEWGTPSGKNPHFKRDEKGQGYLHFDGADKDFYMISGGTAFPYAATWELECRIQAPGKKNMSLIGTANNQINVYVDTEGRICAKRGGVVEGPAGKPAKSKRQVMVRSQTPLNNGAWHKLAVVYDLENFSLYVDGVLQQSAAISPTSEHEAIDHLTVAAGCGFLHTPHSYFTGDIRRLRFYGRNLTVAALQ